MAKKNKKQEQFDRELTRKAFENELKIEFNREAMDYIQKARMIEFLTEHKKVNITNLAKQLGMNRQEVYRMKAFLKCSPKVMKLVSENKIQPYQVGRIVYGLKEKDVEKVDEVIEDMIKADMDNEQMKRHITQINNPNAFGNHLISFLLSFNQELSRYLSNTSKLKKHIDVQQRVKIFKEVTEINKKFDDLKKVIKK